MKRFNLCFVILVFIIIETSGVVYSQQHNGVSVDSVSLSSYPQPWKAALLSAVIPGAGQIYNQKYWKVPLIYTGMGTFVYLIHDFTNKYRYYKAAYVATNAKGPSDFYNDERYERLNFKRADRVQIFEKNKDQYRRWRDLNVILLVAFYVINVVDATVDAHFAHFDISSDLVLNFVPKVNTYYLGGKQQNLLSLGCVMQF